MCVSGGKRRGEVVRGRKGGGGGSETNCNESTAFCMRSEYTTKQCLAAHDKADHSVAGTCVCVCARACMHGREKERACVCGHLRPMNGPNYSSHNTAELFSSSATRGLEKPGEASQHLHTHISTLTYLMRVDEHIHQNVCAP